MIHLSSLTLHSLFISFTACYMNSVLQALSNTPLLRDFFIVFLPKHLKNPNFQWKRPIETSTPDVDENEEKIEFTRRRIKTGSGNAGANQAGTKGGQTKDRSRTASPSVDDSQSDSEDSSETDSDAPAPTSLSEELSSLLSILWTGKRVQFTPDHFIRVIWRLYQRFKGFKQQDAQEFILFILNQLSRELGMNGIPLEKPYKGHLQVKTSEPSAANAESADKASKEEKADGRRATRRQLEAEKREKAREQADQTARQADFILENFGGTLRNQVKCLQCGNISNSRADVIGIVSLPLPNERKLLHHHDAQNNNDMDVDSVPKTRHSHSHLSDTPLTLEQCLAENFLISESISDYKCSNCCKIGENNNNANAATASGVPQSSRNNNPVSATAAAASAPSVSSGCAAEKRCLIEHPPSRYLILHLIRTDFDFKSLQPKKDQRKVVFPLNGLDLNPYTVPEHRCPGNSEWELYALVSHHGRGMNEGHFTSMALVENVEFIEKQRETLGITAGAVDSNALPAAGPPSLTRTPSSMILYSSFPDTQWVLFNDAKVQPIEVDKVLETQAYLLFYKRKDSASPSHWSGNIMQ
jgi:ubiquitin C-terminal hydrolase